MRLVFRWVLHLQKAGFPTEVVDTKDLDAVKTCFGVPDDLAACHTAEWWWCHRNPLKHAPPPALPGISLNQ